MWFARDNKYTIWRWTTTVISLMSVVSVYHGSICNDKGLTHVCEGQTLKLRCHLPPLNTEFRYLKNNEIHPVNASYIITENNRSLTLQIPNITTGDEGTYFWCSKASEPHTPIQTSTVTRLRVYANPIVDADVECISHFPFESMRCDWGCQSEHLIEAADRFNYRLHWNTTQGHGYCSMVEGVTRDGKFIPCACNFTRDSRIRSYTMTVHADGDCDFCKFNKSVSIIATLKNIAKLEPVHVSSQLSSKGVELSWPWNTSDSDYIFNILYYDQASPYNVTRFRTNSTKVVLSDLHPYTTYNISVSVKMEGGYFTSEESQLTIKTPQKAPSAGPLVRMDSFQSIMEIDKRRVTFFWMEIDQDERNGVVTDYVVLVNATSGDCDRCTPPICSTEGHSCSFDLDLDTEYDIKVAGRTDVDRKQGAWSPPIKIPKQSHILPAPCWEALVSSDNNDVSLTIYVTGDIGTTYTLYTCNAEHGQCQDSPRTWTSPEGAKLLSAVIPSEHNVYFLSSVFDKVTSGLSRFESIDSACLDKAPSPPKLAFPEQQPERGLRIEWERTGCSTEKPSVASFYSVTVSEMGSESNNSSDNHHNISGVCLEGKMSHTFIDLTPYTNYTVSLTSCTFTGRCVKSPSEQKLTKQSFPGSPNNITVLNVTSRTASIAWEPPLSPNGEISHYIVTRISKNQSPKKNELTHTEDCSHVFNHLEGFTNYSLEVLAVNGAGPSPEGAVTNITTPMREPSVPKLTQEQSPGPNTVIVRWLVETPNGPLTYYNVSLRTKWEKVNTTSMKVDARCSSSKEVGFNVSVIAINSDPNGSGIYSSDTGRTFIKCERESTESYRILAVVLPITVLGLVALTLIGLGIMKCKRKCDHKIPKRIVIPPDPVFITNPCEHEEGYSSGYKDIHFRHGSSDSTDELSADDETDARDLRDSQDEKRSFSDMPSDNKQGQYELNSDCQVSQETTEYVTIKTNNTGGLSDKDLEEETSVNFDRKSEENDRTTSDISHPNDKVPILKNCTTIPETGQAVPQNVPPKFGVSGGYVPHKEISDKGNHLRGYVIHDIVNGDIKKDQDDPPQGGIVNGYIPHRQLCIQEELSRDQVKRKTATDVIDQDGEDAIDLKGTVEHPSQSRKSGEPVSEVDRYPVNRLSPPKPDGIQPMNGYVSHDTVMFKT